MPDEILTGEQAIAFLYGRIDYERVSASLSAADFKLERMRNLLDCLENPQEQMPAVHIAGTKGKGTTATLVSSILQAAGYQVGLFTSPHIDRFEERIRIGNEEIPETALVPLVARLAEITSRIDSHGEGLSPTFFELVTALAWMWFAERGVDIAVMEVGLGGRLDSTNIIRPEVCVITTISRDHTHILGTRLSEIAAEKAGIIKPGVPVVSGVSQPEARRIIEEHAARQKAPLFLIKPILIKPILIKPILIKPILIKPTGQDRPAGQEKHDNSNSQNHAVAREVIQQLQRRGWCVPSSAIETGLRQATIPLRREVMQRDPVVIADVAHNWISAGALADFVEAQEVTGRRVLIFGTSSDKDIEGLCRRLLPIFDTVILTQFVSSPRAYPVDALWQAATRIGTKPLHQMKDPADAWQAAVRTCPQDGLICIAGSFFLAAEIRRLVQPRSSGPVRA